MKSSAASSNKPSGVAGPRARWCWLAVAPRWIVFIALAASCSFAFAQNVWTSASVDLGYDVRAVRVDARRNVIYVSAPLSNRVFVLDMTTLAVLRTIYVGFHPAGIDLSADGNTLYAALNAAGAIGVYDLNTNAQSEIDISIPLGNAYTWDVAEAAPGQVFAVANPGSSGIAFVVHVDMATQNVSVAASGQVVRSSPLFGKDPSGTALYVPTESGGLYKLDLTQPTAPIMYTSPQYLYGTTISIAVNPTSDRLVLGSGEVIRANELTEDGTVGGGVALYSADGRQIISTIGGQPITVNRFDSTTLDLIDSTPTTCNIANPSPFPFPEVNPKAIQLLPNGYGWAILGETTLCVVHLPDELFGNGFD